MISIIIPLYNQAKKLQYCLESIKNQTFNNYEIIIANDGSTDNVEQIYEKNKKELGLRLELISQENKGANAARNLGLKNSKGEFIIFCDADLTMKPQMLSTMNSALQKNNLASFAYSSFIYGHKKFNSYPYDGEKLKKMPYIHSTSLIRREHFPSSGWDESLKKFQDWDLWLTMLENGNTGVWINEILYTIQAGGSMSSWLPGFAYKYCKFLPAVKKYNSAMEIIKKKHNLISVDS
jgi:glycosyltransferase involved in cell wall biosynthesis